MKKVLSGLAALLVAGVGGGALAQQRAEDLIAACRAQADGKNDRIACLENALRSLDGVDVATTDAAPPPPVALASEEDAPEPVVAAVSPVAPQPQTAAPTGIGAEQVIAREERSSEEGRKKRKARSKAEMTEAKMIDFARTASGRLVIVLDNGQVWAQRAGDQQEVRLREGDQTTVKIRRGAISGYRIEFERPNVTIVAERLQ